MLWRCWILLAKLCFLKAVSGDSKRPGHGLVGYGIDLWDPICASACRSSVAKAPLLCPDDADNADDAGRSTDSTQYPSPTCYATNEPFLQTLAWCMSIHCKDVDTDRLEKWWQDDVPGELIDQPIPKLSYKQALNSIEEPPTVNISPDTVLDGVRLVDEEVFASEYNAMTTWAWVEVKHETFGLMLLLSGSLIPIALSLLRFVPFPATLMSRFNALIIDAPAYDGKRWQAVLGDSLVPSRGQALFVGYFWIINIIFSATGYRAGEKTSWWDSIYEELGRYVANRTGVLSIANLALMVLWAGRNNFLLWLTNWAPSTFILLHRWLAFISILQAAVHSAIFLLGELMMPGGLSNAWSQLFVPYWFWGSIGTVAMCFLIPLSLQQIRRRFFEAFLASHVILALVTCIGYYLHIYYLYEHQLGYENWVYLALAFWAFDRLFRAARIFRHGVRTATISIIDEDYIKLDINGIHASGEAYLYFPTLTWRVWENHPFSIANTVRTQQHPTKADVPLLRSNVSQESERSETGSPDSEQSSLLGDKTHSPKLTILVRTHAGVTSLLRLRERAPVLIEASYGHSLLESDETHRDCQNVVCIAGGVGVTAVAPMLSTSRGRKKLYWGVRTPQLVNAMRDTWSDLGLDDLDMDVSVGQRFDLGAVIGRELSAADESGQSITFAVSGPPSMADEVRAEVAKRTWQARRAAVTFIEKSYSW